MSKNRKDDHHDTNEGVSRRNILAGGLAITAAAGAAATGALSAHSAQAAEDPYAAPENPALPPSDMV